MKLTDINEIMKAVLYQFPIKEIGIKLPDVLGETTGLSISNDEELVSMLCSLSKAKKSMIKSPMRLCRSGKQATA